MNNGFNGTGTAFILYIFLAFLMPFVYVYRVVRRRKNFEWSFVFGHFILGIIVTVIAYICVGYLWKLLGVSQHGHLHKVLALMAYAAIFTIIVWVLIPQLVRLAYRLLRKKEALHYQNPLIHPWYTEPFISEPVRPPSKIAVLKEKAKTPQKWIHNRIVINHKRRSKAQLRFASSIVPPGTLNRPGLS